MNLSSFGFIPVSSEITPVPPELIAENLQDELLYLGAIKIKESEITKSIPMVFLVLTGGTENKVLRLYSERKKIFRNEPILILAHPSNNSLPASLEILAKFQQDGIAGKIIYWDDKPDAESRTELIGMINSFSVYHKMLKTKIGLIGAPSDWLVASSPGISKVKEQWGVEVEQINISELIESIAGINDKDGKVYYDHLTGNAESVNEPSAYEILHAVRVYGAMKNLISKYGLTAISVRCFDLVIDLKTTGCFALSRLNDEGIIAGCEGDVVSALGMIWLNHFTGKEVWMANPARLDEKNNSLWLAHCTVPVNMVDTYKLRSHFESGLGVGIQGEFQKEKVTLVRIGGKNLEKIWLADGEILECGSDENLCRTQVHVKLYGTAKPSGLLNAPLGNHILMVKGNYASVLLDWWKLFIS